MGGGAVVRLQLDTPYSWGAAGRSPLSAKLGSSSFHGGSVWRNTHQWYKARVGALDTASQPKRIATSAEAPKSYRSLGPRSATPHVRRQAVPARRMRQIHQDRIEMSSGY